MNTGGPLTTPYDLSGKRVWVAGHRGMVGGAIVGRLAGEDCEILTVDRATVDLRRQRETEDWLAETRPQAIFIAAATVGGIMANDTRPAEFLYDNLAILANVIEAARRVGTEKLLYLGSSCAYPKFARQPIGDVDPVGHLERRQVVAAEGTQPVLIGVSGEHDCGVNYLAVLGVRHRERHCLGYGVVTEQDGVDLQRRDLLPAPVDQLL